MWKWFHKSRATHAPRPRDEGLKGAPAHARIKTYSAETGFVYQYVYRGYRRMPDERGAEYVFEANRDRKQQFRATVLLLDTEVEQCTRTIGRELIGAERYALAKMSLFAALNEYTDVTQFEEPLMPSAVDMKQHLQMLGRI